MTCLTIFVFAEFWVRITSGVPGVSLSRILGARQLTLLGGGSSQRAVSTCPPVQSPPHPWGCIGCMCALMWNWQAVESRLRAAG